MEKFLKSTVEMLSFKAAHSYPVGSVRSAFGLTSTQTVRFGCNWVPQQSHVMISTVVSLITGNDDEITVVLMGEGSQMEAMFFQQQLFPT